MEGEAVGWPTLMTAGDPAVVRFGISSDPWADVTDTLIREAMTTLKNRIVNNLFVMNHKISLKIGWVGCIHWCGLFAKR